MPYLLGPSIGFGLVTASILALAAVGFTMQFGVTNILNLAYGEVMATSGFVALIVNRAGLSIWFGMAAAAVFGAALSYLLNRVIFIPFARRGTKLFGMVIVTIAVGLILENSILAITGPNFFSYIVPQESTYSVGFLILTTSQIVLMGLATLAMIAVHSLLRLTRLGMAMRATASDASLARGCGIRTERIVDAGWLISGAMCGIAGVALFINTTSFTSATANSFLVVIVAAAILGGVGQPYGAMLGALVIGLTSEIAAAFLNPAYKNVVAFVILVVVLLLRPQGILAQIAVQREIAR
jgi:branched-chain amino acid transport system permease protein/neutral amino acid transport system permease protein